MERNVAMRLIRCAAELGFDRSTLLQEPIPVRLPSIDGVYVEGQIVPNSKPRSRSFGMSWSTVSTA
jgi:hypothetical protein